MKKLIILLCFTIFLVVLFTQCKHDPIEVIDPSIDLVDWPEPPSNKRQEDSVYFKNDILKLMITKCAVEGYSYVENNVNKIGCHSRKDHKGGIILDTFPQIIKYVDTDQYDPNNSRIYTSLFDGLDPMPRLGSMEPGEQNLIKDWITQGAQNNSCAPCDELVSGSFSKGVAPILYKNCSGCHNKFSNQGGISFFSLLPTNQNDISFIDVSNWAPSILASLSDHNNPMPKYIGRLYSCESEVIEKWIVDNKNNN